MSSDDAGDRWGVPVPSGESKFNADVLTEPTTVIGSVTPEIWINPDTPDLDLSVGFTDVYPDGRFILITDGIREHATLGGTEALENQCVAS